MTPQRSLTVDFGAVFTTPRSFTLAALYVALSCCAIFVGHAAAKDLVHVYPAPAGEPLSDQFAVTVEKQNAPVYLARIVSLTAEERVKVREIARESTSEASFASFDIDGSVQVSVTCPQPIQSAKILPTSSGLTPAVSGNSVTFTLSKPGQLTLEVNGDWIHSLHLFANPMEADAPRADDPNVIYYGPGVHEVLSVKVGSGKTVYIAGGAVVYGKTGPGSPGGPIFDLRGSNIVLRGRGIIDGSHFPKPTPGGNILGVASCSNVQIEGITLRDSCSWTFPLNKSDHVKIQNIKIFGWRGNSDGIDICNSQNVDVSDCFLRTFDDLVVIKSHNKKAGPSRDITVKNCVLWNEFAHALSLGAELRTPVENVLFSDCDIIHDKGREWALRVYNCDSAPCKNIVFDNIRIEETRRLFSLWIGKAVWSKEDERGHIDDVTFRNIASPAPTRDGALAALKGFDADHAIHHVHFEHVTVAGKPLQAADVKQNAFVDDVRVTP